MSANSLTPTFKQEGMPSTPENNNHNNNKKVEPPKENGFWHKLFLGPGGAATLAGACEITIFHPFDTTAKRLMSHNARVVEGGVGQTLKNFNHVVFRKLEEEYAQKAAASGETKIKIPMLARVGHMYPGSLYAVLYKVLQRVIKFAGQPYMREYLYHYHGGWFLHVNPQHNPAKPSTTKENPKYLPGGKGGAMLEATAGCLVGVSEVILLPFDRMKVLYQTNRDQIKGMNLFQVLRQEGVRKLYAGTVTTAVRNAPGSFLLFGGAAFTKDYVFQLKNYSEATFLQNIIASTVGGCVGVICTSPMDVVKTRIQSQNIQSQRQLSGMQVLRETVKTEGFSAGFTKVSHPS
ncbi:mitochondrial carrier protein [Angomonas deanei]|nr:mitochondrial carrier protein [Angomonas deanei]|eukprot:EPY25749.1 mitochondrial carrier protein [Angomonas deanei]